MGKVFLGRIDFIHGNDIAIGLGGGFPNILSYIKLES